VRDDPLDRPRLPKAIATRIAQRFAHSHHMELKPLYEKLRAPEGFA